MMPVDDAEYNGLYTTSEAMDSEVPRYTAEEKGKGKMGDDPRVTTDIPNQGAQELPNVAFGQDVYNTTLSPSSKKRSRPKKDPAPSSQTRSQSQNASTSKQQAADNVEVGVSGEGRAVTSGRKRGARFSISMIYHQTDRTAL